jgi:hypothetical protein
MPAASAEIAAKRTSKRQLIRRFLAQHLGITGQVTVGAFFSVKKYFNIK